MSNNNLGTDTIGDTLRGIFAELFGGPRSWIIRDAVPPDGSAHAALGCALEALRYYLGGMSRAPLSTEVRWFHVQTDEIFAEFINRKS